MLIRAYPSLLLSLTISSSNLFKQRLLCFLLPNDRLWMNGHWLSSLLPIPPYFISGMHNHLEYLHPFLLQHLRFHSVNNRPYHAVYNVRQHITDVSLRFKNSFQIRPPLNFHTNRGVIALRSNIHTDRSACH